MKLDDFQMWVLQKFNFYRLGQPNWEYTMRKCKDFPATHILCEINFGHFEAAKTAILTILAVLNFEFFEFLTFETLQK